MLRIWLSLTSLWLVLIEVTNVIIENLRDLYIFGGNRIIDENCEITVTLDGNYRHIIVTLKYGNISLVCDTMVDHPGITKSEISRMSNFLKTIEKAIEYAKADFDYYLLKLLAERNPESEAIKTAFNSVH